MKITQKQITPWLFLAPGIILFLVYVIIPIFQSLLISLYEWDGIGTMTFIGLDNYRELLEDEFFYISLRNNLYWLVLFMLAPPIGLAIAIFLNQNVLGIRIYKSLFFFPFVISQAVVGLVFTWFYDPSNGLMNIILDWFGMGPIAVLADEDYVNFGIIAAALWPQIAYCMILYLTGLNNIQADQIPRASITPTAGRYSGMCCYHNYAQLLSSPWWLPWSAPYAALTSYPS